MLNRYKASHNKIYNYREISLLLFVLCSLFVLSPLYRNIWKRINRKHQVMGEGRERLWDTARRKCFHVCHFHHYTTSSQFIICLLVYKSITFLARRWWTGTQTPELTALTTSLLEPGWPSCLFGSCPKWWERHTEWSSLWGKGVLETMHRRFYCAGHSTEFQAFSLIVRPTPLSEDLAEIYNEGQRLKEMGGEGRWSIYVAKKELKHLASTEFS